VEGRYRLHILPHFGAKRFQKISPEDIEHFLQQKLEAGQLAPRTIDHMHTMLCTLFNFAKLKARPPMFKGENPASMAEGVNIPDKPVAYLPVELVHDVIEAVPERWRNFFALALYMGPRAGELRALTRDCVDLENRTILIWRSGSRNTTKTNKMRVLPIPSVLMPYVKAAVKDSEGKAWLFTDTFGEQLTKSAKLPDILRAALEKLGKVESYIHFCQRGCKVWEKHPDGDIRACPKCGRQLRVKPYAPITFHDLRKTFATHLGNRGAARAMLGHQDQRTTDRLYIGQDLEILRTQVGGLDFRKASPLLPHSSMETTGTVVRRTASGRDALEQNGGDSK
jgi:integrase